MKFIPSQVLQCLKTYHQHIYRFSNRHIKCHFCGPTSKKFFSKKMVLVLKSHVWLIRRYYDSFICFCIGCWKFLQCTTQVELKIKITFECYYENRVTLPIHLKDHRDLPVILRSNVENNFEQSHICLSLPSSGYIYWSSHIEIPTVCFTITNVWPNTVILIKST